jgi:hypothetical protein
MQIYYSLALNNRKLEIYFYMEFGFFRVETLGFAILVAVAGIFIGFISLHIFKFMGLFYKKLSEIMLG